MCVDVFCCSRLSDFFSLRLFNSKQKKNTLFSLSELSSELGAQLLVQQRLLLRHLVLRSLSVGRVLVSGSSGGGGNRAVLVLLLLLLALGLGLARLEQLLLADFFLELELLELGLELALDLGLGCPLRRGLLVVGDGRGRGGGGGDGLAVDDGHCRRLRLLVLLMLAPLGLLLLELQLLLQLRGLEPLLGGLLGVGALRRVGQLLGELGRGLLGLARPFLVARERRGDGLLLGNLLGLCEQRLLLGRAEAEARRPEAVRRLARRGGPGGRAAADVGLVRRERGNAGDAQDGERRQGADPARAARAGASVRDGEVSAASRSCRSGGGAAAAASDADLLDVEGLYAAGGGLDCFVLKERG